MVSIGTHIKKIMTTDHDISMVPLASLVNTIAIPPTARSKFKILHIHYHNKTILYQHMPILLFLQPISPSLKLLVRSSDGWWSTYRLQPWWISWQNWREQTLMASMDDRVTSHAKRFHGYSKDRNPMEHIPPMVPVMKVNHSCATILENWS